MDNKIKYTKEITRLNKQNEQGTKEKMRSKENATVKLQRARCAGFRGGDWS